jgi:hypothetical protein
MPGFASGGTGSSSVALSGESGNIGTVSQLLTNETAPEVIFTAAAKTKVVSVLLVNSTGGSLPVDLYVRRSGETVPDLLAKGVRVHKRRYALQALVGGDSRVNHEIIGDDLVLTETVLQVGDALMAKCPIEDSVTIHATYYSGVN